MRDLRRLQSDPPTGVTAAPQEDNILLWQAVIFGPEDTPWEGGVFKLSMTFTEEYPTKAPAVVFVTPIFHPNVYNDGKICLDILQSQWTPIYDVGSILASIQLLLTDPNPSSPANGEAARLYQENRREYTRRVIECVEQSLRVAAEEAGDDDDDQEEAEDSAATGAATTKSTSTSTAAAPTAEEGKTDSS